MKQYTHPLAGIQVRFPYENPYPQQKVMMSRLITALKEQKNCLIESPTGTGKSLSLLCGALSFVAEQKRLRIEAEKSTRLSSSAFPSYSDSQPTQMGYTPGLNSGRGSLSKDARNTKSVMDIYADLERQVEQAGVVRMHSGPTRKSLLNETSNSAEQTKLKLKELALNDDRVQLPRVPKIFYGTRTHRQVSQVVSEFNRTDYGKMRMTILGSRERMCVNKDVLQTARSVAGSSVNEECRNRMKLARKGEGCIFHSKLQKASRSVYPTLLNRGSGDPWDIEDLKSVGKDHTLCAYYWSVQLAETADIIFCPYNYILDPTVREAMEIDLTGNIVILDEAHNIEDICRDSMGLELNLSDILYIEGFIQQLVMEHKESPAMAQIFPIVGSLKHVLENKGSDATLMEPLVFNHEQLCSMLEIAQIGPRTWPRTKNIIAELLTADDDQTPPRPNKDETEQSRELDARCRTVFGSIANTLGHLYKMDMKYIACFKAAVVKKILKNYNRELNGRPEVTLNIYCLNPAVGLVDIKGTLHSLVVASGTLSPMKSFECELDVPFPISVSLKHVVAENQMLACIATRGPDRVELKCDYKNNMGFTLQDDLGRALMRICSRIPNGVLCFFPSYSTMNRMCERWQSTGTWSEIEQTKRVFVEGQSDLPEMMREYYESSLTAQGALLLAVCRGRVSEGEDFPDNFARAVVIIGLPFPNFKDITIKDKMTFNDDRKRQGDNVMSGHDWYTAQAFRALNQALGRCIRHSDDWGAILLLESRISYNPRYKDMLSRWVRERIEDESDFNSLDYRLGDFVQERKHEADGKSHEGDSEGGRTAREIAKLQSGSGLNNLKDLNSPSSHKSTNSGANGGKRSTKRPPKMFPIFQPPLKRRSSEASTTNDSEMSSCSSEGHRASSDTSVSTRFEASQRTRGGFSLTGISKLNVTPIIIDDSPTKCSSPASFVDVRSTESELNDGRNDTGEQSKSTSISAPHNTDDDGSSSDIFSD